MSEVLFEVVMHVEQNSFTFLQIIQKNVCLEWEWENVSITVLGNILKRPLDCFFYFHLVKPFDIYCFYCPRASNTGDYEKIASNLAPNFISNHMSNCMVASAELNTTFL